MPVFLLPIVAGGYYYLKNRKEGEDGQPQDCDGSSSQMDGDENDNTTTTGDVHNPQEPKPGRAEQAMSLLRSLRPIRKAPEEDDEGSSIEVSLGMEPQHCLMDPQLAAALAAIDSSETSTSQAAVKRKESADTVFTECSESEPVDNNIHNNDDSDGHEIEIVASASSCTDCNNMEDIYDLVDDCGKEFVVLGTGSNAIRAS